MIIERGGAQGQSLITACTHCRKTVARLISIWSSAIGALGAGIHILELGHATTDLILADDQHMTRLQLVGAAHLALQTLSGVVDLSGDAAALQFGGEEKPPIAGFLAEGGDKEIGTRRRDTALSFEQDQTLQSHGKADAGLIRSADLANQTVITAAGSHGILRAETVRDHFKGRAGVIVKSPHHAGIDGKGDLQIPVSRRLTVAK